MNLNKGYKLPAKYIIHTVGPMDQSKKDLISCYKNCLELAKESNCRTILSFFLIFNNQNLLIGIVKTL